MIARGRCCSLQLIVSDDKVQSYGIPNAPTYWSTLTQESKPLAMRISHVGASPSLTSNCVTP